MADIAELERIQALVEAERFRPSQVPTLRHQLREFDGRLLTHPVLGPKIIAAQTGEGRLTRQEAIDTRLYVQDHLRSAELYYIGGDALALWEHAWDAVPDAEFSLDLLPSEAGFVWQERALRFDRLRAADREWDGTVDLPVTGLGWVRIHDVVLLFMASWNVAEHRPLIVGNVIGWGPGQTIGEASERARFLALWMMLGQERSPFEVTAHRPSQKERKKAQRKGKPIPTVKVVDLARPRSGSTPQGGTVDWSHRWIVNGFWRNQWFPKAGVHRPVWIAPYVKGPGDKPLVLKHTVHALR